MLIILVNIAHSQDATFSEPHSEKMLLNSAYAGFTNCPQVVLNYRKQEVYNYYGVSYNQFVRKINSGLGLMVYNNSEGNGVFNKLQISGLYSYRVKLRKKRIMQFGFQVNYLQQNINSEGLVYSSMINPFLSEISENSGENYNFGTKKDISFSVGWLYISKKYRYGISVQHVDKLFYTNEESFQQTGINIHLGRVFYKSNFENSNNNYTFVPEIIYRQQGKYNEIQLGFNYKRKKILTNFWLKTNIKNKQITPVFTIGFNSVKYRFLYSYDILISKYYTLPIHSHQVSVTYNFSCINKRKVNNTIFCKKK